MVGSAEKCRWNGENINGAPATLVPFSVYQEKNWKFSVRGILLTIGIELCGYVFTNTADA